jgi:hypothetical protein
MGDGHCWDRCWGVVMWVRGYKMEGLSSGHFTHAPKPVRASWTVGQIQRTILDTSTPVTVSM